MGQPWRRPATVIALLIAPLLAAACTPDGGTALRGPQEPALRTLAPEQLLGLSQAEVSALLGEPELRRTEAAIQIWQYRSARCVLDLFLYPDGGDVRLVADRVAVVHVETRPRVAGRGQPVTGPCAEGVLQTRAPLPTVASAAGAVQG